MRINWKVRTGPSVFSFFLTVLHSLGYSVLVRSGEGCEYQFSRIWLTRAYSHAGKLFISLNYGAHVGEVQFRINSMSEHIHCNSNDVRISCSFTVAEKCSFYSVSTCKQSQLCVGNAGSSVVVWMKGDLNAISSVKSSIHVFHLICKYVRK